MQSPPYNISGSLRSIQVTFIGKFKLWTKMNVFIKEIKACNSDLRSLCVPDLSVDFEVRFTAKTLLFFTLTYIVKLQERNKSCQWKFGKCHFWQVYRVDFKQRGIITTTNKWQCCWFSLNKKKKQLKTSAWLAWAKSNSFTYSRITFLLLYAPSGCYSVAIIRQAFSFIKILVALKSYLAKSAQLLVYLPF